MGWIEDVIKKHEQIVRTNNGTPMVVVPLDKTVQAIKQELLKRIGELDLPTKGFLSKQDLIKKLDL